MADSISISQLIAMANQYAEYGKLHVHCSWGKDTELVDGYHLGNSQRMRREAIKQCIIFSSHNQAMEIKCVTMNYGVFTTCPAECFIGCGFSKGDVSVVLVG